MLFLTTTAIDIDEELLNRCLVLTIDESRAQTAAIQQRQRASRTLDGLLARTRASEVLATHRAAQALLRPLAVVNPYAEPLSFASDRVRLRRDHAKYLALIDAIALLHQYQRPVGTAEAQGKRVEYIEVTLADIALANRLAHEVLGRSLDELPPQTRRLLQHLVELAEGRAREQRVDRAAIRFTRREVREAIAWGDTQLKVHLSRLEDHEYLIAHRRGTRHDYELLFDCRIGDASPQLVGLQEAERLVATSTDRSGVSGDRSGRNEERAGSGRPSVGAWSGVGRVDEMAVPAHLAADHLSLAAAKPESVVLEAPLPPPSRRNGAVVAAARN